MWRFAGFMLVAGLFLMPIWGTEQVAGPYAHHEAFAGDRGAAQPGGFAADRAEAAQAQDIKPVAIDGKRAMKYLEAICAIGPRISTTAGMQKQQDLIKKHFEDLGAKVAMQPFKAKQDSRPEAVDMANMIISFNPDNKKRVILCSHYDTRPIADQEIDQRNWHKEFVSANDGGSGVALLMELGHHMKELKTPCGVDFVLFDGEEFIFKPKTDKYFFGSKHFAKTWRLSKPRPAYAGAILLDMVGGINPQFPIEVNSWHGAPKPQSQNLVREIWGIAAQLKIAAFQDKWGPEVLDDHIALQAAGIPAIDIIDFSYRHWHKLSDVPANCSADSLDMVAKVLTVWLQRDH
jgi:glutaminyl-peptide cyclotransferase